MLLLIFNVTICLDSGIRLFWCWEWFQFSLSMSSYSSLTIVTSSLSTVTCLRSTFLLPRIECVCSYFLPLYFYMKFKQWRNLECVVEYLKRYFGTLLWWLSSVFQTKSLRSQSLELPDFKTFSMEVWPLSKMPRSFLLPMNLFNIRLYALQTFFLLIYTFAQSPYDF